MKRRFFLTILIVLSLGISAFSQTSNDVLSDAISKLKTQINDHIVEKAYLQFDHPYPYYVAGDNIYFKAYITMGELHEPSTISGILHVELIAQNNTILQSIQLAVNKGLTWGDFSLPATLTKGNYRIRAYTDWMRNEPVPNFFEQYISIGSVKNDDKISESAKQGKQPTLQFFPEGGNLVNDVQSKLAFKAIGPDGLGVNFTGVVTDNQNTEIAKISPSHLGMGEFDFLPEAGKLYKAKVTFADGTKSSFDLPVADAKGITLSVNYNTNKVSIEINANRAFFKENLNKELNLIIFCGGSVRTVKTKLDNAIIGLDIPANTFRTGILQVTLLSDKGEPLNERLAFIQNNDLLNLNAKTNKQQFAKRENVVLNLNAKNKDGNPVNGSFSVSVIDESKILVDENAEPSIESNLLLTSDLKGYVEKPNYYFANINPETRKNLDILMLTQGYRRFVWKQLEKDNIARENPFKPESQIDIAGIIKNKEGKPIVDYNLILIKKVGGLTLMQQTDQNGRFRFKGVNFFNGDAFILKTVVTVGRNEVFMVLDKPEIGPEVAPANLIESKYDANADLLITLQSNQKQGAVLASTSLENFAIEHDKTLITTSKNTYNRSTKLGGTGNADQVILASQILPGASLTDGLNGLVRGVEFSQGMPYLKNNQKVGVGTNNPMLVILDGVEIMSLDDIAPIDVESVELLRGPNATIYGARGGDGVLIINTRQAGVPAPTPAGTSKEMSPGMFSITPMGFYKAREFYAPTYLADQMGTNSNDQRTTIFWKPDLNTDADGNATLSFYNADGTGNYRVVVEGIDTKGNLGRQVFRYKVQ